MINRITRFENLNEIGVYRDNCLNWFTNKYENIVYLVNYPRTKDSWASDFTEECPFKRLGLLSSPSV